MLDWLPAELQQSAKVRSLAAGETLFRRGDRAQAIFAVERGRLRLLRHGLDSQPIVLHTARAGELFAEAALFAATYRCDAVALTPATVRVYPKRQLLAAFRGDPALAERFTALLAGQVHRLRAQLEGRNIRSAEQRVLHHLALAAGADGRTVRIEGTLLDLAVEIGLSHESLYRTLAKLEKAGAIARTAGEIVLCKAPTL